MKIHFYWETYPVTEFQPRAVYRNCRKLVRMELEVDDHLHSVPLPTVLQVTDQQVFTCAEPKISLSVQAPWEYEDHYEN